MAIPRSADGEPVEQLGKVDRSSALEESVDVMGGTLHGDTALKIDEENFEGSRVGDSRAFVDRW